MPQRPANNFVIGLVIVSLLIALDSYKLWAVNRDGSFVRAAGASSVSKVKAGLDSGIDPNKASFKGVKALAWAVDSHKPHRGAIVRLLLDYGEDPNDGLSMAVGTQQPDMVQLLISRGANVNPKVCCGDGSLLLVAAQTKNNKIIRLLKAAGAKK